MCGGQGNIRAYSPDAIYLVLLRLGLWPELTKQARWLSRESQGSGHLSLYSAWIVSTYKLA